MIPLIAGILLFLSFSSLYYFNLSFLEPLYVHYDLFGMDSFPFLNILFDRNSSLVLHPFSKCLYYLPHMFSSLSPVSLDQAVRFELALIGGGNVALAFLVLRAFLRNSRIAALFAVAFGLFFSNLVFFSVPETYLVSDSIVLVYALLLVRFHDKMTVRRYLILSALAGIGAANNLPLASLLVPHSYILWKERKSVRRAIVTGIAGMAVVSLVFLSVNGVFLNRAYFTELFAYGKSYGTVSHLSRIGYLLQVAGTFILFSVIAPCRSMSSDVYNIGSYFARFGKFVLLVPYVYYLDKVSGHLMKHRDRVIDGLLLWLLLMTLAYVYFSPQESFIYSSQMLLPVCLIFAKTFEASRIKFKYSFAAVFIVLMGCNNLFCLYHPCELDTLIPRQPIMGNAFIGNRIRVFRERAGITIPQLAGKTGIDQERLMACEKGQRGMETNDLHKIARALQQPLPSLCSAKTRDTIQ